MEESNVYLEQDGSGSIFAKDSTPNAVIARQFFKATMCAPVGVKKRFASKKEANTFRAMLYRERENMSLRAPNAEENEYGEGGVVPAISNDWHFIVLSVEAEDADPSYTDKSAYYVKAFRPKELGNVESF